MRIVALAEQVPDLAPVGGAAELSPRRPPPVPLHLDHLAPEHAQLLDMARGKCRLKVHEWMNRTMNGSKVHLLVKHHSRETRFRHLRTLTGIQSGVENIFGVRHVPA